MSLTSPRAGRTYLGQALDALPVRDLRVAAGARCVDPEMAAFAELRGADDSENWRDLASIAGATATLELDAAVEPKGPWRAQARFVGALMTLESDAGLGEPDDRVEPLDVGGVEDIRALTHAAGLGTFPQHALRFGRHVGIHQDGRLIAVAGRRFQIDGHVEVAWFGTDPAYRQRGAGAAVVRAVCREIVAEGLTPYLIVLEGNRARALYERLGFSAVRRVHGLTVVRAARAVP